jgi:LytS/YehU family sensor histidine kinase
LLSRAELERSRREATLGEVRLEWLQGSFDPRLMRDVLTDIQRRQASDPAGAERLLDELVGFLRLAMPSLRHTASTLAAEVALVQAYAKMQRERHGGQGAWRVSADDVADIAFPPLLLLSLLDASAREGQPSRGTLSVRRTQAGVHIAMTVDPGPRARPDSLKTLTHRLEIGLRALHEDRFEMRHDAAAGSLEVLVRPPGPVPFPPLTATNLEISR